MEKISEEDKSKYEINKMFDLAEKVLMEYFCYYLDKKPNELFKNCDVVDMKTEELILYPIDEYKKDKYLSFKLELVQKDFVNNIPDTLKANSYILDTLDFFKYSINEVFNAIVHHSILEDASKLVLNSSFHLEFEPVTNTFKPVYIYPIRRQSEILAFCKHNLEKFYSEHNSNSTWDDLDDSVKLQWQEQYSNTIRILENLYFDANIAKKEEDRINAELENHSRIGIIFNETDCAQVPS